MAQTVMLGMLKQAFPVGGQSSCFAVGEGGHFGGFKGLFGELLRTPRHPGVCLGIRARPL